LTQKINILIVDDVEFSRDLLRSAVKSSIDDHDLPLKPMFFHTSSGRDVLSIIQHKNIDLVYLDIDLPDTSGLDILKKIKEKFNHVKVVMVSGENSSANVMAAIQSGTCGFIVKPFNSGRISSSLKNYLKADEEE
jgi:two-component system chemotaxis response regulator CheY